VENLFWKRLWTCRNADNLIMVMMFMTTNVLFEKKFDIQHAFIGTILATHDVNLYLTAL